jgi:hypothetical protein
MSDFEERLRSALDGIELTDQEDRYLYWLSGWDLETVETFAGLFEKCRADRPEWKMYAKVWGDGRKEYRYGPEWVAAELMAEGGYDSPEKAKAAWLVELGIFP